jgi:hypothetical protein
MPRVRVRKPYVQFLAIGGPIHGYVYGIYDYEVPRYAGRKNIGGGCRILGHFDTEEAAWVLVYNHVQKACDRRNRKERRERAIAKLEKRT